jgi:hypothetical protein
MNEEALDQLFADLGLHETAARQIKKQIRKIVKAQGGISLRGLSAYETQTITDMFPLPDIVIATLPRFIQEHEWPEYCRLGFNAISQRAFKGFVRKLPVGQMVMDVLDNSGQLSTIYGKATFGVRTKPPIEGKVHIVMPGEKPLVGDFAMPEEEEDDE